MYKTKYLHRYLQVSTQMAMDNNPSSKRAGVVFFALAEIREKSQIIHVDRMRKRNQQILGGETEQPSDSVEEDSGERVKSEDMLTWMSALFSLRGNIHKLHHRFQIFATKA
jgi:hypothetical protein